MMRGVVKYAAMQFVPIPGGEPVSVAERGSDVCGITRVRRFLLLFLAQDSPIHDWAVGDHFCDPRVQRGKNGSRATETSTDDEDFMGRTTKFSSECQFLESVR